MDKRTILFMLCVSVAFLGVQAFFHKDQKPKETVKEVALQKETVKPLIAQRTSFSSSGDESFYVLENDYQQLVFSTRGGSLAEINLPLANTNEKSIVKEIDFDREIVRTSPQNAKFPLNAAQVPGGGQIEGKVGGYYPLLRRALNGNSLPAEYYALNVVGEDPNIANATFRVT